MGLKASVRSGALSAFNAIGDLADTVTYSSVGTATYDLVTGAPAQTDTDYESLKFVREEYKAIEITPAIMGTDFKGYLLYENIDEITPKNGDFITGSGGNIWEVINWENIYDVLWKFQLRPKYN